MRTGRNARGIFSPVAVSASATMAAADAASYDRFYPYYAEVCALSEIKKKPGSGVDFRSGMGGHSLLYLNGVCRDRRAGYPTLKLCEPGARAAGHGVGISVNSHYRNANWVATEGRDFVFRGMLRPGERLTRAVYERTQASAREAGVLEGVEFHDHLFKNKPRGMSKPDYMYEISVATDYAVTFGRHVFRARVPLDRARMSTIVDFLNGINAPYRDGTKEFRWRILNNNCSHLAHNALATAGVWESWPTGQFLMLAAFNFPVPKNEFVDLMFRTNDLPLEDPAAICGDMSARRALLDAGFLPTAPGGLASALPAPRDNDIYDTTGLRLIFYDNPFWGPYSPRFHRIFTEPRYFDLRENLRHFQMLYDKAREMRQEARMGVIVSSAPGRERDEVREFYARYDAHIERESEKVKTQLTLLRHPTEMQAEALP